MNTNQTLRAIQNMLEVLLTTGEHKLVQWVGGYTYGRTSNDDPFIILYPASEHLEHKVCRVYDTAFNRLPPFINTQNIPKDATDGNPKKGKDKHYKECHKFKVLLTPGKETQMGRELRFHSVLLVSNGQRSKQRQSNERQTPTSPPPADAPPSDQDDFERFVAKVNSAAAENGFTKRGIIGALSLVNKDVPNLKSLPKDQRGVLLHKLGDPTLSDGANAAGIQLAAIKRFREAVAKKHHPNALSKLRDDFIDLTKKEVNVESNRQKAIKAITGWHDWAIQQISSAETA